MTDNQNDNDALKPDREKIAAFAEQLGALRAPAVESEEALAVVAETLEVLGELVNALEAFANQTAQAASAAE